jgi:hypothetical protein
MVLVKAKTRLLSLGKVKDVCVGQVVEITEEELKKVASDVEVLSKGKAKEDVEPETKDIKKPEVDKAIKKTTTKGGKK